MAQFGDSGSKPPSPLRLSNARTHHHHHLFPHTPPTPSIVPHSCFTWRARNQAPAAWFQDLGCKLPTPNHHQHHHFPHTPPTPSIALHSNFQQCTRNRAPVAWFRDLGSKPLTLLALSNNRTHYHHHLFSHTPHTPSISLL